MGSVVNIGEGKVKVGDDFELIGWDFVSNPSTHGAFMTPVTMNESVNRQLKEQAIVCGEYCKAQDLMREIITELA
jgi:diaminopimelate decarboxylase